LTELEEKRLRNRVLEAAVGALAAIEAALGA